MKKIKTWILILLIPFQKLLQRLGRQETKITKEQVDLATRLAEPGDILLSFEYGRLTSVLIDGFFDHAAVVTNKLTVIEAVGDRWVNNLNIGGVREVEFEEWLYKKDYVAIVRPIYNDGNFINKLASREALVYKGKNYDYSFTIGPEKLYCSEIPYLCYRYNDSTFMNWVNENIEILPQMYYELTKNIPKNGMFFKLIYDSRGTK